MDKQKERPIVLSIAGFDPCGGAGVLADIKTLERHGVQGMAVLTANTVQTEDSFSSIVWVDIDVVQRGVKELMGRYAIPVVKIGIVKNVAFLEAILASVRACNPDVFVIWDPVIKSSSGFIFFGEQEGDTDALATIVNQIDLITPNLDEYQALEPYFETYFSNALLIKGGHRHDDKGVDILRWGSSVTELQPQLAKVYPKHGSGCVLSSAIAAHIAYGQHLEKACREAKVYTERFLNSHPSLLGFYDNAK